MEVIRELTKGFFWDTVGLTLAQLFWKGFAICTMLLHPPHEFEFFHRCAVDGAVLIFLGASLCRLYQFAQRDA